MIVIVKTCSALAVAYLLMVGLLFLVQRPLLYHPGYVSSTPEQAGLSRMSEGTVKTADGILLRHWFAPPADAGKPVGILLYGNAAYMEARAQEARSLQQLGYGVLLVSYRGYDGNAGSPTEQGLYADARANVEWLKAHGYQNFFFMGQSLGSGVAVQMATEFQPKALILETPYTSMIDAASDHYPFVPVHWLLRDRYDSISKISRIHAPVFIIQGEADEVIPVSQGRALFAAANEPKEAVWLPGAHHNDYYNYGGWPQLTAFLSKYTGENNENMQQ